MRFLVCACFFACGAPHAPSVPAPKPSACVIRIGTPRALPIPSALAAIAPQYFHPGASDTAFNDLIAGTARYRFYDPQNLDAPVEPPPEMTEIHRATKGFYFGWGSQPRTASFIARRTDAVATKIRAYPVDGFDMVEDTHGHAWLLVGARDPSTLNNAYLLDIDPSLAIRDHSVVVMQPADPNPWDRRIGITKDGNVAVVWVEAIDDGLVVVASWLGPHQFRSDIVDRVSLSAAAIDATVQSTDLRVAADGADRIAIAWRPLAPKPNETLAEGSTAQVRIVTTDVHGTTSAPKIHAARAKPIDGDGLADGKVVAEEGSGMMATTLADRAVFFWLDDTHATRVVLATAYDIAPREIASGTVRLVTRARTSTAVDLLLLQSGGPQRIVSLTCE